MQTKAVPLTARQKLVHPLCWQGAGGVLQEAVSRWVGLSASRRRFPLLVLSCLACSHRCPAAAVSVPAPSPSCFLATRAREVTCSYPFLISPWQPGTSLTTETFSPFQSSMLILHCHTVRFSPPWVCCDSWFFLTEQYTRVCFPGTCRSQLGTLGVKYVQFFSQLCLLLLPLCAST